MSNILFPTAELAPFVKRGGVADVAAALPKALRSLGHKVTVVAARTSSWEDRGVLLARRLTPLTVKLGDRSVTVTVYDGRLSSQVDLCVLEWPEALTVPTLYDGDAGFNAAVFSSAIAELVVSLAASGVLTDVVHLNDWPTAAAAAKLALARKADPALSALKIVLTVHSFKHQGRFGRELFDTLGAPGSFDHFEFFGGVNLLKAGLVYADQSLTVSPTYAQEVASGAAGEGLEGVVAALPRPLGAVLNGVDASVWNPATDSVLTARYDAENVENRVRCKAAFVREHFGEFDPELPLCGFVGRFDAQKGVDVLLAALPALLRGTEAQFVISGEGDAALESKVRELAEASLGRVRYLGRAPEEQVRRLFSAADVILVPSRFEPCGLVQLYAQRYGAFPVAHATGGLRDTLVDCDAQLETGTGFLYDDDADLVGATERALAALVHPRASALRRRIMRLDRGWERSARQLDRIYAKL